jgi:hypothetical protein
VLYYRMFLAKVQETPKPLQSHSKDYSKAIKSYSPNNLLCFFVFCFGVFGVIEECIEKTGGSGRGQVRGRVGA